MAQTHYFRAQIILALLAGRAANSVNFVRTLAMSSEIAARLRGKLVNSEVMSGMLCQLGAVLA